MTGDPDDTERLPLKLAAAISDEKEIDGQKAEASATADQGEVVEGLRQVARIAAASRAVDPVAEPASTESPAVQPIGRWGHLELLERLAEGSYGEVYRARDTRLDRQVALKLLRRDESSDQATEVIREARLLARIAHPGVARVYGAERRDGRVGIWMELIRGKDLEQMLNEQGSLGAEEAARIGQDLCRALAAVHKAGLLHRDVKTRNVMRAEGGRVVLIDFGAGGERARAGPEAIHETTGTPLFMAPEQFRGGPATTRSDLYSLGVVLFRLVTGCFPVEGRNYVEVSRAHGEGRVAHLADLRPDLPEAFVRVVEKALAPSPDTRFDSAGELERALANTRGAASESTRAATTGSWRLPATAAAATIVLVGLLLIVWRGGLNGAYDVDVSLRRVNDQSTEPLYPGATIAPGDRLLLECRSTRSLYVYVVSRDEHGEAYLLFPMRGSDTKNPLAAGVQHHLPGTRAGQQLAWTVTSSGGHEHMVIVASPQRLRGFESDIFELDHPREPADEPASPAGDYSRVSNRALVRLRGIGGYEPLPDASGATDLLAGIRSPAVGAESMRGAWVRQIDLVYARP